MSLRLFLAPALLRHDGEVTRAGEPSPGRSAGPVSRAFEAFRSRELTSPSAGLRRAFLVPLALAVGLFDWGIVSLKQDPLWALLSLVGAACCAAAAWIGITDSPDDSGAA